MDVGIWLRSLGLEQYEQDFRDNKIDADVLPRLTADDLRDIGVSAVGDRRRLVAAIAALAGSAPSADVPVSSPKPASPKARQVSAERRPVTVMFCDLVGSTSLAARLDPEDSRNLVAAYLDEASNAVTGLGGHVLKKLGDGLMALFGYPQAQENDAERAVRAALAIQRAIAEINTKNAGRGAPELRARIGLESGPVVVDAAGEVFGEAPNTASRVEAEPGSVLITMNVQLQVAGLFVAEERGARELSGVSEPVKLFRIVRASGAGRRGGARAPTPFVGREEDLAVLARRWERARAGDGQFVLIVGEPGVGKSRLIEEFRTRLAGTPHTWVGWSASQLLQNTPLHAIAESGRQRIGGADASSEQRLAELESFLRQVNIDADEVAPLLAPVLDIPLPPGRAASLAPEEMRRRQLASIVSWVMAGARAQPVILAFEDLQWADPTSIDVLGALAERGGQARLFLVATSRPEFRPSWGMRSHHGVISLAPLDRAQVRQMVAEIASRHAVSKDLVEWVSERTGGVPLFVEEVTHLLLERGEVGGLQAIPPTLQQLLAARLDRLGAARETAQIGSVLGRSFSHALLQAVADLDVAGLRSSLERLAEADIMFVDGVAPQANYRFKHALIQDAAYDSLTRSRRQELHHRAAEVLRAGASPEPEAIAHHFTQAGLDDLAIEYWGKAGDLALRRSAFKEAIAHLGKAIVEMAEALAGAGKKKTGEQLRLQVSYGNAMIAAHGHGAPETVAAFTRAHELGAGGADMYAGFSANYGLWAGSYVHGDLTAMREPAQAFLRDVESRPGSPEAGVAHRAYGVTEWFAGDFIEARSHLEQALAIFDPERDRDLAFRFGQDVGVSAMVYLAIVLWPLGEVARARELVEATATRIAELGHLATSTYGLMHSAMFEIIGRNVDRAAPLAKALSSVAYEHGIALWISFGAFLEAWVELRSGSPEIGLLKIRRSAALLHQNGVGAFQPLVRTALAEAEAGNGETKAALATLEQALKDFDRTGQQWFDAEIHRMHGEILLEKNPANPAPAEDAFLTAIALAQAQKAGSFELRAALSLAKLYRATGRDADAHAALGPALGGFSPTPEFPEIEEALEIMAKVDPRPR